MNIALLGSPTLLRYTEGILHDGLVACGCKASLKNTNADFAIIQIHGSPAARAADFEILQNLQKTVSQFAGSILLLHRPDEIKDSMPQLRAILSELPSTTGLVMLGDLLINDPFYQLPQISQRVIPHGFFDIRSQTVTCPVIVGTHTTWGEMRSVQRTLSLLKALKKASPQNSIIGYLGGIPAEALSLDYVTEILLRLEIPNQFTLRSLTKEGWRDEIATASSDTIFLRPDAAIPEFDVTFNVQLYHYGQRIRFGESSGSLHASCGIPVIFEMNGSERIENLQTVKVPYSHADDAESADFESAARQILALTDSGEFNHMLRHNRQMSERWNNKAVAQLYVEFLESLAKK